MIEKFVLLLLKLIAALPLSVVHGPGRLVGFIFGHVVRHYRKEAFIQLARSIPKLSPKERRRTINSMYCLQGINMMEMVWYSTRSVETVANAVEVEGLENIAEAHERGKGVLMLTAHICNYELMPMLTASAGYTLNVVVKRIKNKLANTVIERMRSYEGVTFLPKKMPIATALKHFAAKKLWV